MTLAGRVDVDQAIREFRGDEGNVAAFLTTEVYAKQPPTIREFLLRTCLVDQLSPGLASALTGQGGAAGVLQFIAHGNAFVKPVPGKPGWYRYQSLFREFLRSQLSFEHPELRPLLHRVAAEQLAAEGHVLAALQQAVAGDAWSTATRILVDGLWVGGLLVGGHRNVFRALFARLPRDTAGAAGQTPVVMGPCVGHVRWGYPGDGRSDIQSLASGLLMGLLYGLIAVGLALIFGLMDVNFAHGEFLMIAMYATFFLFVFFAIDPRAAGRCGAVRVRSGGLSVDIVRFAR